MILLLHTTSAAHTHPDQLLVALIASLAIIGTSWMYQRRRS
ncbi:MAG TPA: hypothetical protein VEK79_23590 [Thermoanaerobaculia bacterium]|nr:hypothetical protein [Thermoanaerobaculia bacterium]